MFSLAAAMSAAVGLSSSCSTQASIRTHNGIADLRARGARRMPGFLTKGRPICNARGPRGSLHAAERNLEHDLRARRRLAKKHVEVVRPAGAVLRRRNANRID